MKLIELKYHYQLSNIELAKAIMREPTYVSKLLAFKVCPSLMQALVINKVTKGLVAPHELIQEADLKEYFKRRQKLFSAEYPHWFPGVISE
jgi:DNA-binding transcriptional regulator YdaS (Cro superfamily)